MTPVPVRKREMESKKTPSTVVDDSVDVQKTKPKKGFDFLNFFFVLLQVGGFMPRPPVMNPLPVRKRKTERV